MGDAICSVPTCERPAKTRGWCQGHYSRVWRGYGLRPEDPLKPQAGWGLPLRESFERFVDRSGDDCHKYTGSRDADGYGMFSIPGKRQTKRAHRVAWEIANGPIPDGMGICHTCDTPPCCRVAHLFLGTPVDNQMDKIAKGRHVKGETVGTAVLTEDMVREMRAMYQPGVVTIAEVAEHFPVSWNAVRMVIARKSWAHVE